MKNNKLKLLYIGLVLLFLYLPIIILVVFSFNDSQLNIKWEGFTLKWYGVLFQNKELLTAFLNTIIVAITAMVVSTVIGTLSAVGLYKYNFKLKGLVNSLLYIPIVIPEVVLGISLLSIYTLFKLNLGMFTLILAHITFCIPFVIINVRSVLSGMDSHLEEASLDLGASRVTTFFRVTIPELLPGIKSGALLTLTLSLDDVIISYFTAGPNSVTLPLKIYSMIKTGITPDVNALSTLMLLVTFTILIVATIKSYKTSIRGVK